jgi:AcrR family transcriptional regulator
MKRAEKEKSSGTRLKLLMAAIELFGRKGYDGTSIREIADKAKANIAGIAYHFGGKDELYRACIHHILETIRSGLAAQMSRPADEQLPPSEAREALKDVLFAMTRFILATPHVASFVRIVVREQMDPTASFDILYGQFMEPMHRRLCRLWSLATGDDSDSEATKIAVFGLLGQVLVFRIARAGALRRMGWRDIGEQELAILKDRIGINVDRLTQGEGR